MNHLNVSSIRKSDEVKTLKVEIKHWRKELGEERKQKMKLEKALSELEAKSLESNQHPSFTSTGMLTASSTTSSDTSISSSLPISEGIDCTVCAEPILNYKAEYFNAVEMNPACDNCKIPSDATQPQPELSNDTAAADAIEREKTEEIEKVRRGIRSKVKAKLDIKLRKGEIRINDMADLEDELLKELEEELVRDFEEELIRKAEIT